MVESVLVGGSTEIERLWPVKFPLETYKATENSQLYFMVKMI